MRDPQEAAACESAGIDMIITAQTDDRDITAFRAAAPETLFFVGLLYGAYASPTEALRGAYRAMEEGADAIYCPQSIEYVRTLATEAIPVTGHVGFIPYKRTWFGGFKAVGKTGDEAYKVYQDALAHQEAGAIGVEIEIVPSAVGAEITKRLDILTIGMGSGAACDVHYLFSTDILGTNEGHVPRHAKVYRDHKSEYKRLHEDAIEAFKEYKADVETKNYPLPEHSLKMKDDELRQFLDKLDDSGSA
ncbi:MAG: 3-methyl-2-oxobutanoate hydroxymethyltransferase [Chloroflexota bacterium]